MTLPRNATSRLKRLLFIGLGLPLLLLCAVLALAASEYGSRWLLLSLEPMLPARFDPTAIQGRLLGHISIGNIEIKAAPHKGNLKRLELDWQPGRLLSGQLQVRRLLIQGLDFHPGQTPDQTTPKPAAQTEFNLALPLHIALDDIQVQDVAIHQGGTIQRIEHLSLRLQTLGDRLVLESLELAAPPLKRLGLKAALGLARPHPLEASLNWQLELPEIGTLSGQGRLGGNLEQMLLEHLVTQPFKVNTSARITLGLLENQTANPVQTLDFSTDWQDVRWPLTGATQFHSKSGQLRIKGPVDSYQLQLDTGVEGPEVPSTRLQLLGQGSTQAMDIKGLTLSLLNGSILTKGRLGWTPEPNWDLQLEAKDLKPSTQWPEVPGSFSLLLTSQGALQQGKPRLEAELKYLKGLVNQLALEGQGLARLDGEHLRLDRLNISAGKNQLQLNGELAQTANFQALIDAPELARLWPGLRGSLNVNAQLKGELSQPNLRLDAKGKGIGFKEQGLKTLDARLLWNPKDAKASSTAISLKGLSSGKPLLDSLTLNGPGNLSSHQWQLDLAGPMVSAKVALKGGLDGTSWRGQLQSAEVKNKEAGHWQLTKAFDLELGAEAGRLDSHCWQSRGGSVCLDGRWDAQQRFNAQATLKALPLAILESLLPPGEHISGSLNGQLKASGSFSAPSASLDMQLPECRYQPNIPDVKISLNLKDLKLTATLKDQVVKAGLDLGLKLDSPKASGAWGNASARLGLRLGNQPRLEPSSLKLDYPDIASLGFITPAIAKLKGRLALDLKAQGPATKPELKGGLTLADAGLELPDTGIKIEHLGLSAQAAAGQKISLSGQASSGNGTLELKGLLDLDSAKPRLDARLKGQNFQVARIPMAEVTITPDFNLSLKEGNFQLNGSLLLPKAIITLKELPEGSVAVSDDVVIIDDKAPKTAKKEELPPALFNANIDLRLGDEVSFRGFGLKTRIQGRLNIESTPGKPPLGNGNLNLVDGSFKAFGQDLSIERGRFLFSGPLDQPGLDIQAVRQAKNEEVKAGVMVSGPVKSPEVKVFSIPPKPTSEALSYLLTGSGLKSASPEQASAINSAAWSMQKAGTNMLTGGIAKGLGLSEFSFGGESAQSSALNLGKQLSPDLYLRYVRNLFDNSAAMEIGYKINKTLDLKVYGGSSQGLDLYYHRER